MFRIITDNAANMIKVYKFGLNVNDDDDDYNLTAQDGKNQQKSNDFLEFGADDDINILNEWIFINWCERKHDSSDIDDDIEIRLSCFALTVSLQLAIRDSLKDAPYLSKSLAKCIKLARRSHKQLK